MWTAWCHTVFAIIALQPFRGMPPLFFASAQTGNFFSDPNYSSQEWVYEMINVKPVWERGIFGSGVHVRVNDNGIDTGNAEFDGRFDFLDSCDTFEASTFNRGGLDNSHGTRVAAIIGAAANNDDCSAGIAPEVTISSCSAYEGFEVLADNIENVDISQNSYGVDACMVTRDDRRELQEDSCPFSFQFSPYFPCGNCDFSQSDLGTVCEENIFSHCQSYYEDDVEGCSEFLDIILGGLCYYGVLSISQRGSLSRGVVLGREGKGIIYITASGNVFENGDDTNFQAFTNSRFFITVGAVGKDMSHASYSVPGASLFLTAPGGDREDFASHFVTSVGGTCDDAGIGTSFSSPVVAAVVALLLEVNPELSWRDVQDILARTARRVEDTDDPFGSVNAAGIWHSNLYGFGVVDAAAAIEMAEEWNLLGDEMMLIHESGVLNVPIVDDESEETLSTIKVASESDTFVAESVVLQLDVEYFSRGHLQIVIDSPQGTRSILTPGQRPENTQLSVDDRWKLLTLRAWGEDPNGDWKLTILDNKKGEVAGCVSSGTWQVLVGSSSVTCTLLERDDFCRDGEVDPDDFLIDSQALKDFIFLTPVDGQLATEACCACGGGITREGITDRLKQWRLIVYGHESAADNQVSASPSIAPSGQPSTSTSANPSTGVPGDMGGDQESASPSIAPSGQPSTRTTVTPSTGVPGDTGGGGDQESASPSIAPSGQPSTRTTVTPSTDVPGNTGGGDDHQESASPSIAPSGQPSTSTGANPSTDGSGDTGGDLSPSPSSMPSDASLADSTDSPTSVSPTGLVEDLPSLEPSSPVVKPSEAPSLQLQDSAETNQTVEAERSREPSLAPSSITSINASNGPSAVPSHAPSEEVLADNPPFIPSSRPGTAATSAPSLPTAILSEQVQNAPSSSTRNGCFLALTLLVLLQTTLWL